MNIPLSKPGSSPFFGQYATRMRCGEFNIAEDNMEDSSPVSLNFGRTFNDGSRQNADDAAAKDSSNPIGSYSQITGDGSGFGSGTMDPGTEQQGVSIDSIFDQDIIGSWSPFGEGQHDHNDPLSSVHFDPRSNLNDKRLFDKDNLPAWSDLKTKAGKERKRLPLACIDCRRKKIKCSGEKPACKHCVKARVPCVYKNTTRKAAPRTDYMAMLDKRLKRMEDRVIKMIPKEDLPDLHDTGRSSVRPPAPGPVMKKETSTVGSQPVDDVFAVEANESILSGRPAISEAGIRNRTQREFENKLSSEGADALPPPKIQEHLAELFFDCLYGQSYLLLHKPSFIRKLKAGKIPPVLVLAVCAVSARFSTHPQVNTEPAFLRGEQWATTARQIVERRHFEPNVTILTVMLMLGMHYFGTCEGGLSWSFGGQASRMAYALQLHRELDHDPCGTAQHTREVADGEKSLHAPELSFVDREIRRRLMWACYLMDAFNSSGTERPSFLNEEYIKIQLPIKEAYFQSETPGLTEDIEGHVTIAHTSKTAPEKVQAEARANLGVAAYVIRAIVIWKKIVQYLNMGGKEKDPHVIWDPLSQFASLQRQIQHLKTSLPDSLMYTPENLAVHAAERLANQFLFLHIVLAQMGLFLHRFAIPTAPNTHRPYPPNTPKPFLAACATTVVESASLISKILADSSGHTLTVPFAGYCAYAAATVHVWGIFSKHQALEESSQENLRHNYRYLTRMKRYWGMFHYMAQSVKDIYRAFAEAAKAAKPSVSRTPAMRERDASSRFGTGSAEGSFSPTPATLDTIISADPSRAPSPIPRTTEQGDKAKSDKIEDQLEGKTQQDPPAKTSTKQPILQFGDWFNRYPHGVSEAEWETTHHPHKQDCRPGQEAVMSQKSDLQSVEEFMASLSPPSKAVAADHARDRARSGQIPVTRDTATEPQQGRGKKIARRNGKDIAPTGDGHQAGSSSVAGTTAAAAAAPVGGGIQLPQQQQQQQKSHRVAGSATTKTQYQTPQQQQPQPKAQPSGSAATQSPFLDLSTTLDSALDIGGTAQDPHASNFDIAMSDFASSGNTRQQLRSQGASAFDVNQTNSPSYFGTNAPSGLTPTAPQRAFLDLDYNSPSTSNPASAAVPQQPGSGHVNFNFNYTSALPHLDRQMVYGAYAGLDPSMTNNSSALNNPSSLDFWGDPWDGDITGDTNINRGSIDMDGFGDVGDLGIGDAGAGMIRSEDSGVLADNAVRMPAARTNHGGGTSGGTQSFTSAPAPASGQQNSLTANMGSAAWLMPFNIDPPYLEGFEDFSSFDAMDMSGEMAGLSDIDNNQDGLNF